MAAAEDLVTAQSKPNPSNLAGHHKPLLASLSFIVRYSLSSRTFHTTNTVSSEGLILVRENQLITLLHIILSDPSVDLSLR